MPPARFAASLVARFREGVPVAELVKQGAVARDAYDREALRLSEARKLGFRRCVLPLVHGRSRVRELLRRRPVVGRRAFYLRHWDTWTWRLLFRLFFSRPVLGRLDGLGRSGRR